MHLKQLQLKHARSHIHNSCNRTGTKKVFVFVPVASASD